MIGPAVCSTHDSGTVDVHLIPTPYDDEVDHMPMSGTRMHPGGLAFILYIHTYIRTYVRTYVHTYIHHHAVGREATKTASIT